MCEKSKEILKQVVKVIITLGEKCCKIKEDVRYRYVTVTAIICSIISYLYLMVNDLHNYDTIGSTPSGDGAAIELGRWLVHILYGKKRRFAGGIWYNSSFFNIGIALILLWLSCILVISILDIKSRGGVLQ